MPSVFNDTQIKSFSDKGGIYDTDLRTHCIKLNEYLNDVTQPNYEEHINTFQFFFMILKIYHKWQDICCLLLQITTEFLPSYLILIDELQIYGRQLGTNPRMDDYVINPKDVGFHLDNAKNRLILEIIPPSLKRKCGKHSNTNIKKVLKLKLDMKTLKYL